METVRLGLKQCAALPPPEPGADEGSATDGGGGQEMLVEELDYTSLMRGDRRHFLPPPMSFSFYLCTYTQACMHALSRVCTNTHT